MSKHHLCCRNLDRTMCGQSTAVVGQEGDNCTLCTMIMNRRPLMCPLGGNCGDPVPATQPVGNEPASMVAVMTGSDHMHTYTAAVLSGEAGGSVRRRAVSEFARTWWVGETPSIEGLTDEDLADFIYERFEPFRNHEDGEHHCPCWRCTMLRKTGFHPELTFQEGCDDMYVRAIRKTFGTALVVKCMECEEPIGDCVCERCPGCEDLVDNCECGWCPDCECGPCRCNVCGECDCDPCECSDDIYECGCDAGCSCGDCWDCHEEMDCDCEECNDRRENGDDGLFRYWSDKHIWEVYFLSGVMVDRNQRLMNAGRDRTFDYDRVERHCREGNEGEIENRRRCVEDFRRENQ